MPSILHVLAHQLAHHVTRIIKCMAQVVAYKAAVLGDARRRLADVFGNRNSNGVISKLRRVVPRTSMSAVMSIAGNSRCRSKTGDHWQT